MNGCPVTQTAVGLSKMSKVPIVNNYDDSMSDEVFEDADTTAARSTYHNGKSKTVILGVPKALAEASADVRTPSPTGYPGFKPPKEALQMYAFETEYFQVDRDGAEAVKKQQLQREESLNAQNESADVESNEGDGWQSYRIEDTFDDNIIHKVCIWQSAGPLLLYKYRVFIADEAEHCF